MIEDCEFEEYDEPPVFGKKTIFTTNASGSQEQWGQCDDCYKWRKLPSDVLLPPKWTCADNVWDPDRCSCSAPEEMNAKGLERAFKFGKDFKARKLEGKMIEEQEPSGLNALATAAVLGETIGELGESSAAGATTRHPRHRPGCSCIVCIQPPSGKGKHKPNCFCNVCLTVRRRFKTLMLRKKKRLSDQEGVMAQKTVSALNTMAAAPGVGAAIEMEVGESSGKGGQQLDLNCDPVKEEDVTMVDANANANNNNINPSGIPLEWKTVFAGLVPCSLPNGTSDPSVVGPPSPSRAPPAQPVTDATLAPADDPKEETVDKAAEDS
ncbi:B3 domain-containing transcription repressor VAL1-like [Bidens hawaiensis]